MPQIKVNHHAEVAGFFFISTDKRGEIARFPNLITNGGLDRMGGFADWLTWCQVGSGSTTPSVSDSALVNRVNGTNATSENVNGIQSTEPYYTWRRKTFRFAQGTATGNLSEVGVGWLSSAGLFSRALILDAAGDPTTITIQSDETLDVTYEFRYYPKTTDDTGGITLTGNIGGTYDWVFRAMNVTFLNTGTGWSIDSPGNNQGVNANFGVGRAWFSGELGSLTGSPTGTLSDGPTNMSISVASYSSGSYERVFTLGAPLGSANFAGGIGGLAIKIGIGAFQVGFTPKIPKTSSDILSIVLKHSWGRRA